MGKRSSGFKRPVRCGASTSSTPPVALDPLFEHEPLLAGVTRVCEPFCGRGNLVLEMRTRGLTVFASDIADRSCPDSTVLDFRKMTERPPGCDVLVSNPAFDGIAGSAMEFIEHALALRFRVIVLLLKVEFLCTAERYVRLHPRGHLRRVHVLAERLQGMHDATHIAAGEGRPEPSSCLVRARSGLLRPGDNQSGIDSSAGRAHAVGTAAST
jgi:hypothetical protein